MMCWRGVAVYACCLQSPFWDPVNVISLQARFIFNIPCTICCPSTDLFEHPLHTHAVPTSSSGFNEQMLYMK